MSPHPPNLAATPAVSSPPELPASRSVPSSLRPGPSSLPPTPPSSRPLKIIAGLSAIALLLAAFLGWWFFTSGRAVRGDLLTHPVRRERLEMTIVERGALESAKNADIVCNVKSGAKGSSFATTIKAVIDDGTHVEKGEVVMELDKSGLEDQLQNHRILLTQAEADFNQAEDKLTIEMSQTISDIKTAEVAIELAELVLRKYREGDYLQLIRDIKGRKSIAESDLEMVRERSAWAERMVKKGYLSESQARAERSRLSSAELALLKVEEELRVLNEYEKQRAEKDLHSKLEEAHRALKRVQTQSEAKLSQARTELETKRKLLAQAKTREKEIVNEIANCTIRAPQDGMVVYFINEAGRSGSSSRTSLIAQGEPVSEGQKMLRIPDLKRMQVNVKVHEAMVSRVGVGQPAQVRVDAFPSRILRGHVRSVATVASQADFFSSDVKVYQTMVAIDDPLDGIKPGMSAEVNIEVERAIEDALCIPVQAIVGGTDLGRNRKCFVMTPTGPQERDIVIGLSNDRMAEVKQGLQEGDEVVINPKAIVGDRVKTRQPAAEKQQMPSFDESNDLPEKPKGGGKTKTGKGKPMPEKKPEEKDMPPGIKN